MVKVKRANHRSGVERPSWGLNGKSLAQPPGATPQQLIGPVRPPGAAAEQGQPTADEAGPVEESAADRSAGGFDAPVRLDEIAVAALALSDNLRAATRDLPDSAASGGIRRELDAAAGTLRAVADDLGATAGRLIRQATTDGQECGVAWGVCPDHGITLLAAGETATCRVLGCRCDQTSPADQCAQPVAYRVVDVAGPAVLACRGHAMACRFQLDGAVIMAVSDSLELL